jgi:hypothetical protein
MENTKVENKSRKSVKTEKHVVEDFCISAETLAGIGYGTDHSDEILAHIYPAGMVVGHMSRD